MSPMRCLNPCGATGSLPASEGTAKPDCRFRARCVRDRAVRRGPELPMKDGTLRETLARVERLLKEARREEGAADQLRLLARSLLDAPENGAEDPRVRSALIRMFRAGVFDRPPLSGTPYDAWRRLSGKRGSALPSRAGGPLLSLIMPVYDPRPAFLEEALLSVRAQTDPRWELCVADDASTNPEIARVLRRHREEDPRIRVTFRTRNGHISAASNSALDMAEGTWCGLLDHDDVLDPEAVALVLDALESRPDAAVLFTDEDHLETDADGKSRLVSPLFKAGFDPDLLLACNAVSHLGVYRTSLLRSLGGFRIGMEGAQDYDLALRFLAAAGPRAFIHLPAVLYHWRSHEDSTARSITAKPYAREASFRARRAFVERSGPPADRKAETVDDGRESTAEVTMLPDSGFADVRFRLPSPVPLLTLIVAPWDSFSPASGDGGDQAAGRTAARVRLLLDGLDYAKREVLLLVPEEDPGRSGSFAALLRHALSGSRSGKSLRMVSVPRGRSAAEAANTAASMALGGILGLVRAGDVPLEGDWAARAAAACWRRGIAAAGCRTVTDGGFLVQAGWAVGHEGKEDGTVELRMCPAFAGLHVSSPGYYAQAHLLRSTPAVSLSGLFCRAEVWQELGGLDPAAGLLADADFCLRAWADRGWRSVVTPGADLLTDARPVSLPVSGEFARRWGRLLAEHPPFQSPVLSWAPGGWRFRPDQPASPGEEILS